MATELLRIGVGGVVPIRWELAKADDGTGTLTGWASVYGNVDFQDDVVMPGAFRKWLAKWKSAGTVVPLTLDHENGVRGTIGSLADVVDRPFGLRTTFKFASTSDAQDARVKAKEGHVKGLSIFGNIINKSVEMVDDRMVRILREVELMAVGLTPLGANAKALVTAVKTDDAPEPDTATKTPDTLPDLWVADMRAAITITSETARALAVKALIADLAETTADQPAGDTTEPDEHTDADAAGQDGGNEAAAYALSILGESEPDNGSPAGGPADLADQLLASIGASAHRNELQALAAEFEALKGE